MSAEPPWFTAAIAAAPERLAIEVEGASIEVLRWGQPGDQPDLLLIHGNGAHAEWWRFIAPLLAVDRRVVAFSLSGMGNSAWREAYSVDLYASEAIAAASATGLCEGAAKPWIVAHSFGSVVALHCLDRVADHIGGIIVADNGVRGPRPPGRPLPPSGPLSFQPDRDALLGRFRLQPSQPWAHDHIRRFLAETSIVETPSGWRWKFDPSAPASRGLDHGVGVRARIASATVPLAFLYGEDSVLIDADVIARTRAVAPGARFVGIPDAGHHLMLDQPLAFVAAVRALIA